MQAVAVPARIDAENAVEVLASLSEASTAGDPAQLVLDLAPLQQFDSSALSLLLQLVRNQHGAGQSLRLLNPPAKLRGLADLYGVAEMLFGEPERPSNQHRNG